MSLYAEFLICLEHARSIDARVISDELRGCAVQFAARRWIVPDGYQTSILVPVLNCEEEVEVVVDQERGTFRYRSPAQPSRFLTRPLEEKRVSWDQTQLAEMAKLIAASGDRVEDYLDVEFSVPESRFTNWPTALREQFAAARTVKPGKASYDLTADSEE